LGGYPENRAEVTEADGLQADGRGFSFDDLLT